MTDVVAFNPTEQALLLDSWRARLTELDPTGRGRTRPGTQLDDLVEAAKKFDLGIIMGEKGEKYRATYRKYVDKWAADVTDWFSLDYAARTLLQAYVLVRGYPRGAPGEIDQVRIFARGWQAVRD